MVLPGHIAGGYLAARAVFAVSGATFDPSETTALYLIGTISGELPDIDLLYFYIRNRLGFIHDTDHRKYITHAPIFWLCVCAVGYFLGYVASSSFTEMAFVLILAGTFSHFVFDSLEYGIRWIWPISKRPFALRNVSDHTPPHEKKYRAGTFGYYWSFIRHNYFRQVTIYFEIIACLAAIWLFLNK